MNGVERNGFKQLQQLSATLVAPCNLSEWTVKTGKHGLYYLHRPSGLPFQTLGAAKVAVYALNHVSRTSAADNDVNGEKGRGSEHCILS